MFTFVKIAWRNILRNKQRSFISVTAIAVGLGALILIRAFTEGMDRQMIENYTDLVISHIQIHKKGFHQKMGLERSIERTEDLVDNLLAERSVIAFTERVKKTVLISSPEQASGALLIGIDPSAEYKVTKLHKKIRIGEKLSNEDDEGIIVGREYLDILNVSLGEKIVITAQDVKGELVAGAFRIRGVIDTGSEEIDKGIVVITLKQAQELFGLGRSVSEIAIKVDNVYGSDSIRDRLNQRVDTGVYEVLSWKEISPMTAEWLEFDRTFIDGILLIVMIIIFTIIFNIILMGVFERVREFGIMLALGTKRREIVLIVALESCLLGMVGVLLGLLAGVSISGLLGQVGINVGLMTETFYIGSIVYPRLYPDYVLRFSLQIFFICVLVSIYPAWKAANIKPVETVRYI